MRKLVHDRVSQVRFAMADSVKAAQSVRVFTRELVPFWTLSELSCKVFLKFSFSFCAFLSLFLLNLCDVIL